MEVDGVQLSIGSGPSLLQPNYGLEEMADEYKIYEYGTLTFLYSATSFCNSLPTKVNALRDREIKDLHAERCSTQRWVATSAAQASPVCSGGATDCGTTEIPVSDRLATWLHHHPRTSPRSSGSATPRLCGDTTTCHHMAHRMAPRPHRLVRRVAHRVAHRMAHLPHRMAPRPCSWRRAITASRRASCTLLSTRWPKGSLTL